MFEKLNSVKKNLLFDGVLGVVLIGSSLYAFASRYGADHQDPSLSAILVMIFITVFCLHGLLLLWLAYKNYMAKDIDKAIKFLALGILLLLLFSRIVFHLGIVLLTDNP